MIRLTKTDIKNLSTYVVQLLKQIQHLPVRTSTAAVLILAGQIPVEAELHNKGNNKITELRTILQRESQNS